MTAHYQQPILLIEFDEKKSFTLEVSRLIVLHPVARSLTEPTWRQTYAEIRPNTTTTPSADTDLRAKLVLLTISFPRLRIIWSSSPYQTVDIFRELKENRAEPDADKALLVGVDESEGGEGGVGDAVSVNAGEVLRALPGVTMVSARYIMGKVENLEQLVGMGLGEVQELMGVEPGKKLFEFVNRNVTVGELDLK